MTLKDLLPTIEKLTRQDKLILLHHLIVDIAREEEVNLSLISGSRVAYEAALDEVPNAEPDEWDKFD